MVLRLDIESPKGEQTIRISTGRDQPLTDILRREHLPLNTRCGQRGLCDGCVVELLAGAVVRSGTGERITGGSIRACECHCADTDLRLHIPPRSLLAHKPQVVSEFRLNVPRAHDPVWQAIEVPVDGDLPTTLARHTKRRRPIRLVTGIPATVSDCRFATLEYRDDHWLVTHLRASRPARALGAAFDIGTTTVALMVVDLHTGEVMGRAADFNKQMHLGDDVATRIGLCTTDATMLRQLQEAVVQQTIQPLLTAALQQADADIADLACLSVAANTTMLHLFAGVDPSPMGTYPFRPGFLNHKVLNLPEFGEATIHLLPSAAAYIGADLTAGILSSGLAYDDGPSLLVDVGTNGEIILKAGGHLLGCATAAGPAFEGAGLTNGVRAGEGAVERISFNRSPFAVEMKVIGNTQPVGLCGSAYVDFLAAGRRIGLLTATGRIERDRVDGDWLKQMDDGWAIRVVHGQGQQDILVSETDVAHLLQSKAAIGAGILTLLERAQLTPLQIKKVYLAGGFGMHINIAHAIACGLLPGFSEKQVQVVGNTSLAGAYLGMLDCGALDEVARIARQIEIVELNLEPQFESRYVDQLSLPNLYD